jgi:hypothetical protein
MIATLYRTAGMPKFIDLQALSAKAVLPGQQTRKAMTYRSQNRGSGTKTPSPL